MATVVLDNTNLDAIVADAKLPELPVAVKNGAAPKVEVKAEEKPPEKTEAKAEEKKPETPDADDVPGEDGITPRERRELSAKMLKAVAKRYRAQKEAEEFGEEQYNQRRMAEKRLQDIESENRRLKAQMETVQPRTEEQPPKRADFETDQAYNDAVIDFRVNQKFKEEASKRAKEEAEARQAQIMETARARVQKAMELVPDYQEVLDSADLSVPPVIAGYMQESELFAELGYHFANHPTELERISKLSPARALVEVGKIESKLQPFADRTAKASNGEGPKAEAPKTDNGAKPSTETGETPSKPRAAVITPLNTTSGNQVEKPEGEMNAREALEAWRQKNAQNLLKRARH